MDNPQHYQPLSHALLHQPLTASQSRSPYGSNAVYTPPHKDTPNPPHNAARNAVREEEEEDEEEEEQDNDEEVVEEQLNTHNEQDNHDSNPGTPQPGGTREGQTVPPSQTRTAEPQPEVRRRPGRPRGSKNRKNRVVNTGKEPSAASGPPPHPNITTQNQQYYEFQWRILNLCAEFYEAAEELVKATNPLVIAQCYHMGPTAKVDPLSMLSEAKRVCDTLLANPSQLVANPPPPMYPVMSQVLNPTVTTAQSPNSAASSSKPAAPVITNPQSFVVSLGSQPPYATPQYAMYGSGQYSSSPYYQYPYSHPPYYSAHAPSTSASAPGPSGQPSTSVMAGPSMAGPSNTSTMNASGAWSDEEVDKLKKLAEESKTTNANGDIDWEYVVRKFGDTRTRHQLLIKATALGLKESSTRGVKRRRENEQGDSISAPPQPSTSSNPPAEESSSHNQNRPTPTPTASPALLNQQRPPSSAANAAKTHSGAAGHRSASTSSSTPASGAASSGSAGLSWPVSAMNVGTHSPSPVISASTAQQQGGTDQQQRTSYYRPRPTAGGDPLNKSATSTGNGGGGAGQGQGQQTQNQNPPGIHHYMYASSNGRTIREAGN